MLTEALVYSTPQADRQSGVLQTRILPAEEWPRLAGTELETVWPLLPHDTAQVLVVERNGEIVACWSLMPVYHVEGLWLAPGSGGGVFRALIRAMRALVREKGVTAVLTNACTPAVERLIQTARGRQVPGTTHLIPVGD